MNPTLAQPPTIAGTPSLSVRTLRSFEEVEELRSVWESWQFHPNSDIDYYLSRFKLRPEFLRPNVIVVCRDGVQDAMLVGRLDKLPMEFRLGYWRWSRWEMRVLSFPYAGLLGNGSQDNVRMMVDEIMRSLREREAETASLVNVRVGSPLYEAATQIPGFMSRDHCLIPYLHCSFSVPPKTDNLYRRISSKSRNTLRRQAKKILQDHDGEIQFKSFQSPADLEVMTRDVEEVARKTYQRGLGVGFKDNQEIRVRLCLAARKGWLRSYVLYVCGKPSAFWVGTLYRGTHHLDFLGYDPTFESYSLGTFLLTKVLEEQCGNGVGIVDFGYGEEAYKQRFGDSRWNEATVRIFAPSMRGLVLNLVSTQSLLVDRLVKSGLQQIGLLSRLKKTWRRRVTNRKPEPALDETTLEQYSK
jgi:hypothetical protein